MDKKIIIGTVLLSILSANEISAASYMNFETDRFFAVCDNIQQYKTNRPNKKTGCFCQMLLKRKFGK